MLTTNCRINIDPVKTGQNLKAYRIKSGLSVKDVTKSLGLQAPQSVYKWERGDCLPRIDNFFALCCLYKVSPTDLCCFYDKEHADYLRNFFLLTTKAS